MPSAGHPTRPPSRLGAAPLASPYPRYAQKTEVWPSVNAMAESYRLAQENPELGSAIGFSAELRAPVGGSGR